MNESRLITADEIARELQISRAAAYRVAARIPHHMIGRSLRIDRADYEAWLTSTKRAGKEAA